MIISFPEIFMNPPFIQFPFYHVPVSYLDSFLLSIFIAAHGERIFAVMIISINILSLKASFAAYCIVFLSHIQKCYY